MAKAIQGSVGKSGVNGSQSVLIVQYLLNCVPAANGGPVPELVVDGIAGPKTIAAIERFQKAHFSSADGKVDAKGNTLKALQQYDPFPQIPLVIKGQQSKGLKIGGSPGEKGPYKVDVKFPSFKGLDDASWARTGTIGAQKSRGGVDAYKTGDKTGYKAGFKTGFKDGYKFP